MHETCSCGAIFHIYATTTINDSNSVMIVCNKMLVMEGVHLDYFILYNNGEGELFRRKP